jgi:cell division protein FtsW
VSATPTLGPAKKGMPARSKRGMGVLFDPWLLGATLGLIGLGLIMVESASITQAERSFAEPLYYFKRQALYVFLGLLVAAGVSRIPLAHWDQWSRLLLLVALILLTAVLVPGLGREVNGSLRWLALGPVNVQVSELARLFLFLYLASYVKRYNHALKSSWRVVLIATAPLILASVLLLCEPDLGAAAVLFATALGMLFLAGAKISQCVSLAAMSLGAFAVLILASPYRLSRMGAFLNPWADPLHTGFQLTQSLIAIGRGEWLGVGLGGSVQKLFYLPEAHTDFLFAVLAEELGLLGVVLVIGLYACLVKRAFAIGAQGERFGHPLAAYLAYGLGLWFALQAFVNIGVNMGVLPTKGLTLPLMSYGGSSMVVMCAAWGLLIRAHQEVTAMTATLSRRERLVRNR